MGPLPPSEPLGVGHELAGFDCGQPALNSWLGVSARTASAAGTAAVYVVVDEARVVAYYALAMSAVARIVAPARLGRGMPDPVPVVLLARLALARSRQGEGAGGRLLADALRRCARGGEEIGARAVVVDAIDDAAAAFYRHFGFRDLGDHRLWRKLSDIRAALAVD